MRITLTFIFTIVILGILMAQTTPFSDELAENQPIFQELIRQPDAKLKDIQHAFKLFAAKHPDKYKQYHRWESRAKLMVKSDGTLPSGEEIKLAYLDFRRNHTVSRTVTSNWVENGPQDMPVNVTNQPNGLGRINEIAFEPDNSATIYAGAPTGGLWKSTNAGATWTSYTDDLPSLGVSAIVVDKDDPNTIFIGTGDRDSYDSKGQGILKSTDGGNSFTSINNGILSYDYINDLIQDPTNGDILIAASQYKGVYRTDNHGDNWKKMDIDESVDNLAFKPGDPQIVYASTRYGKFFRSTDNGRTWKQILTGFPNLSGNHSHRTFLAVTPAAPDDVYIVRSEYRYLDGVYRSNDSGASFTKQASKPNILGKHSGTGSDKLKGQGWYDLTITAHPTIPGLIYVGAINIWESIDYGVNWVRKSHWTELGDPHADQHQLIFAPNGDCYSANDGGIYYSTDGWNTSTEISDGLGIAQLYKLGQSKNTKNLVLAGFQDNGTGLMSQNNWVTIVGGDGMECTIDPTDDNYKYTSLYYGKLRRSKNNSDYIPISTDVEDGSWVTPYKINPKNPNMILTGRDTRVWCTTNAKAFYADDVSWFKISPSYESGKDIEISAVDGKLTYYSTNDDDFYRCDDITAPSPTWTELDLPKKYNSVNDILTHPTDLNTVYITLGTSIFKSIDKGETWIKYKFNFPTLRPFCLAYDKNTDEGIYAGTAAGIYYLQPNTTEWTEFMTNLPVNVDSRELEIYYDDVNPSNNLIRVATYGRGLWSSPLASNPVATFSPNQSDIIEIFPNPTKGEFVAAITIKNSSVFDINIYHQASQLITSKLQVRNGRHTFDLTHFPKGVYFLEVNNQGVLLTQKIILE